MELAPSATSVQDVIESEVAPDLDVEDFLRRIAACMVEEPPRSGSAPSASGAQQVVLDVRLHGMRFTLTRSALEEAGPRVNLSPREKEIVRLIAKGLPNKAISDVLDISPWTVATHLRRVFAKLGVVSRAEMVARVMKIGMLESR